MRRLLIALCAAAAVCCGGSDGGGTATSPTPPPSDRTFLAFTVESGFGLPPGQSIDLTPDNASFTAYANRSRGDVNSIQVYAETASGTVWGLWLGAPQDRQLVVANYPDAVIATWPVEARPGVTLFNRGITGCAAGTGQFRVLEADFGGLIPGTIGFAINRLHATFEQRCIANGQPLSVKGELNIARPL